MEPTRILHGAHTKPIRRVEPKSPPTRQLETKVYLIAPERDAIDNELSLGDHHMTHMTNRMQYHRTHLTAAILQG